MNDALKALITRSRIIVSVLIFLLMAGTIAYIQIPKEAEPAVTMNMVMVNTMLEGVSPVDAERLLVRPLEEQFKNLEGLKEVTAKAYQGGANVTIEFEPNVNIDFALQEVRNKVDMARREMPSEMEEPQVDEINMSRFPMMVVMLSGDADERTLLRYARSFRDELKALPGVLDADVTGVREEVVEIVIDPAKAQSYHLNSDDLVGVFSRGNRLIPAGMLDTGQGSFSVTVPGLFETAEDILNMPVKATRNAEVRVRDIADIRRTFKDAQAFVRINGERAVSVEIVKRTGSNEIILAQDVRAVIEREKLTWPQNLSVNVTQDQSQRVLRQIGSLQNSVMLAIFLVMTIVIATLGPRSGLLVGIAIPGAFLMGILFLALAGLNVNNVVMFALILSVGILVDGAIVVSEYADRKMAEGLVRLDAYIMAAQRMAWPIISSTLTTIAAFIPLLFWPGLMGEMMLYMPITVICVLAGSLLMALVFVPTLGGLIGRPSEGSSDTLPALSGEGDPDYDKLHRSTATYVKVLNTALSHPGKVIVGTVSFLILVMITYSMMNFGVSFFPDGRAERANLLIHGRGNLSVEEKDTLIKQVEERVLQFDDFTSVYARTGASGNGAADDVIGQITLNFKDWRIARPSNDVLSDVLTATNDLAGIRVEYQKEKHGPAAAKPIEIELTSNLPALMDQAMHHVRKGIDQIGGFINVEDTRPLPGIEWRLEVDRAQAARFGADLASVGSAVRLITNGVRLGTFRPDDSEEEIDILVRYPLTYRSLSQLDELRIETNKGLVPISNFVERIPVQQETGFARTDNKRVLEVTADVGPRPGEDAPESSLANIRLSELRAWLAENPLDPRVQIIFKGDDADQRANGNFLLTAFALGMFLMAAILLVQFNSFYSVLLILSSVVLSTLGVLLGYLVTGQSFSVIMSGIGVIALAGIVVNNNIVLIDTYDRLVKTASSARNAILQTGAQRLRPVFLTTVTTVLGLIPMANAFSINFITREVTINDPSAMWWQQLAMTIIFGLLFATVLTLIFTPCALMLRARRAERKAGKAADDKSDHLPSPAAIRTPQIAAE